VGRGPLAGLFGAAVATALAIVVHYAVFVPREQARAAQAASELASCEATIAGLRSRSDAADARARASEGDLVDARATIGRTHPRERGHFVVAKRRKAPAPQGAK
jgi:hypothetical protein